MMRSRVLRSPNALSTRRCRRPTTHRRPRRHFSPTTLHQRARRDWGYGTGEDLTNDDLIDEKYRGIRPAFGYPACPDHTEKAKLFDLLGARAVGIDLTESFAMTPAASVSGIYLGHPKARYFNIGRIGRDQVEDYARRKGMPVLEAERWLAPNLGYDRGN